MKNGIPNGRGVNGSHAIDGEGLRLVGVGGGGGGGGGGGEGGKVLSRAGLLRLREELRRDGRTLVQCHGCFDLVHPGHIRHLRQAKSHGDVLLVSITGDAQVSKGAGRPLIPQELRAENLAALDFVDWVYVDPNPTAEGLLGEVCPDVYIKGREYERNHDPRFRAERLAVEGGGGRVVFTSGDVVFSSSALIASLECSVDPYHARLRQLLGRAELGVDRLGSMISGFRGKRVVVVGETILDTYVLCDRPEVAHESPVLTLRPIETRMYDGGAAIIARHLAQMGARPVLVTALPRSYQAEELRARLDGEGVEVRAVLTDEPVPEKQRFLAGAQKVMKVDHVRPYALDASRQRELVELAVGASEGGGMGGDRVDAAIVADFGLGLLSAGVLGPVCDGLRKRAGVLTGDVSGRRGDLLSMRGMDLLCPSEAELRDAVRMHDDGLPVPVWELMRRTGAGSVMVTLGPEGLIAFGPREGAWAGTSREGLVVDGGAAASAGDGARTGESSGGDGWVSRVRGEHVPAMCAHAVDPLGCGDALLAAATLALCVCREEMVVGGGVWTPGRSGLLEAAVLGSIAAATQGQRLGNLPVSASELRRGLSGLHSTHLSYAGAEVVSAGGAGRSVGRVSGLA